MTESLALQAYHAIEELIVTMQLVPGEILSEQGLVERLGLGRTPIREALQQLNREGLVVIMPRRGVMVSPIDLMAHIRLMEVRRELERLVMRRAAERATESERSHFAAIEVAMREAADTNGDKAFLRADQQFNELTVACARNEFAARSLSLMQGLARRFWYLHYREAADLPKAARLHADIAGAIARGNGDEAAAASDRLMDYLESFARTTLNV